MTPRPVPSRPAQPASGIARTAAGLAVWVCLSAIASAQSVWELSPYRMQLVVALAPSPAWQPQLEAQLCRNLVTRCDAEVGTVWDTTASPAPPELRRAMLSDIDHITVETLPAELLQADKVALLAVVPAPNGHQVVARQLDVRTRLWNRTQRQPVWQPAKLRDTVFRAAVETFAPLARIENRKEEGIVLHPRGGGLPAPPASPTLARAGQVFLPIVRANDRDGNPRGIKQIPWTFFVVAEPTPSTLHCQLYTGLRNPLSGRRRGRIEWLALAVDPPGRSSRLTLASRTNAKRFLSGYDVVSHPPGSKKTAAVGRTNSRGTVLVPPAEHPLRLLVVSSGGVPVARLPIVPGLEPELTAAVPDDDDRLAAEGFITALQEQLVDLVTRREVLLARARSRIQSQEFDDADALITELESLQRQQTRLELLLLEQQKTSLSDDPVMQSKIDKLFADTKQLLAKHLTKAPLEEIARQLRESRPASP